MAEVGRLSYTTSPFAGGRNTTKLSFPSMSLTGTVEALYPALPARLLAIRRVITDAGRSG